MVQRLYRQLGQSIRTRREQLGMTQDALAKLVKLSRTSVTNVERGGQQVLVHQLIDFARALNVEVQDLLEDIVPEPEIGLEAAIQEDRQ